MARLYAAPSSSAAGAKEAWLEQLRIELAAHWPPNVDPDDRRRVEKLLQPGNGLPGWSQIYPAEAEIVRHMSSEALRLKYGNLKEAYSVLAGAALSRSYFARQRDPARRNIEDLRAGTVDMVANLQRLSLMRDAFERVRARSAAFGLFTLLGFSVGVAVAVYEAVMGRFPIFTILLVVMGATGGCVSALSRLYAVPWTAEFALGSKSPEHTLRSLKLNLGLSIIEGAIFAIVLHLIFMSNLVDAEFVPNFRVPTKDDQHFHWFFETGLNGQIETAKALVWAFAAGFIERLVPDFIRTLQLQRRPAAQPAGEAGDLRGAEAAADRAD